MDELTQRTAANMVTVITETRPTPDGLYQLLETELAKYGLTRASTAQARGVVIGIVGMVLVLGCGIAAFYGAQVILVLMQLIKYG